MSEVIDFQGKSVGAYLQNRMWKLIEKTPVMKRYYGSFKIRLAGRGRGC
jgi:hypothetical protein